MQKLEDKRMEIDCVCGKKVPITEIDNHKKQCGDYQMITRNVSTFDNLSKTVGEFKAKLKSFTESYDKAMKQIGLDDMFPSKTVEVMIAKLGEKAAVKLIEKISAIDSEDVKKWLDKKKLLALGTATFSGGMFARMISLMVFGSFNPLIILGGGFGLTTLVAMIMKHFKGENDSKTN